MTHDMPLDVLDTLQVASPCTMRWEDMDGDERVRSCEGCGLNVYNISEMTRAEAEDLLRPVSAGSRVCARFYRRADGTVITRDCPVGWRAVRRRTVRGVSRVAAAFLMLLTGGGILVAAQRRAGFVDSVRSLQPFDALCGWLSPRATPPVTPGFVMGDICVIPAPPPPPAGCSDIAPNEG